MEKFGLFDLIDKFNAVASGKNDFAKPSSPPQKEETSKDNNSNLVDPKLPSPTQYVMNAKLLDFCSRHDNLSKKILEINCKK